MNKKISSSLTAVTFAAALTLAGTVEAGPLAPRTAELETSPWSLALTWLSEVWGDLTNLQGVEASHGGTSGGSTQAGCGIDPNGLPCGDQG